jgi:phospholipase C
MSVAENLASIDTIVIVMMENRSFDHVLGFLSHESFDGRVDVNGLHQHGPNFDWDNPDSQGNLYAPTATPDGYLPGDVPHSRQGVATELAGGAMNGFIKAYQAYQSSDRSPVPMRFCRPEDIPITAALARRYAVCDRWFASLPDDTFPNRLMALSGTTMIDSTNGVDPISNPLPPQNTVFDWLAAKGKSFEIYGDARSVADAAAGSFLLLMQSQWKHLDHAHTLDTLQSRWRAPTKAPDVIYCEPFYNDFATAIGTHGNCNHPPLPMAYGEDFLKRVYEALTSNPAKWKKTMLVICYDEHGGFFDHVTPPRMTLPPPAGSRWTSQAPFTSLGVRIPGIVVSPFVPKGACFNDLLDHTSIQQLIVDRFGSSADLAYFGDAAARKRSRVVSLAQTLTATTPDPTVLALPAAPTIPGGWATSPMISEIAKLFRWALANFRVQRAGKPV